jgi:hypothetical protein
MNRFALLLVAMFPCVAFCADEPKPIATELEGVWQEPGKPGDNPTLRMKITFTSNKVKLELAGQTLTGTVRTPITSDGGLTLSITYVDGDGALTKGLYSGRYLRDQAGMTVMINPKPSGDFMGPPRPPEPVVDLMGPPRPYPGLTHEEARRIVPLMEGMMSNRLETVESGRLKLAPVQFDLVTLKKVKK